MTPTDLFTIAIDVAAVILVIIAVYCWGEIVWLAIRPEED
jgi:hypothetical protein